MKKYTNPIIFFLIFNLISMSIVPYGVLAAPAEVSNQGSNTSQRQPLPPFPEDANRAPIDWSKTDWDAEAVLPKDQEEFDAKLRALESQQKYSEISQLKRPTRLWSDDEVMAYYQVPTEVKELVRGYRTNVKKGLTPEHRESLKSFLAVRIKSILLTQNYYPADFAFDNKESEQSDQQKIDINQTAPLKVRRVNGVQKPDANNVQFRIKSLLQNPSNANWWEGKVKKPGKKVSWSDRLLWLVATPAEAYFQPTTPIIQYYDGIEKNPIDNALYYLAQTQNEDGSWGTYSQYELTAWLTFILSQYNKTSNDQYTLAVNYVKNTAPKNNREKAVKAWILICLGEPYQSLLDDLLTRQNSDGGYGINDNYASDVETTLDALAAFWKANATVLPASLSYVLTQIQADGTMRYASEASPSYFLMNKTAEYLKPFGQVSQTTQDKLNLLTNYLASQYNLEQGSLANTNDVVDELMTLQTLKSYSLSSDKQVALTAKINAQQAGNGSFGQTLHAQLAAFKALAQSDLVITNLQSTGALVNGQTASFDVTIKNNGYLASGNFKLYDFVDGYKINDGHPINSLPPGGQIVFSVGFDSILTRSIIGSTNVKFYAEADNEFNYTNNWKENNFTFAPHASGFAALPLYYIAQRYSIDGLPAINFRYLPKADPNRINYVFMWRLAGETQWGFWGIEPNRFPNGVFVYPFANNSTYEITAGALRQDGVTVDYYTSGLTIVKTSSDDVQYAGNVTGYVTVDHTHTAGLGTFGYGVYTKSDNTGAIAYNNAPNGTTAAWVDTDAQKQYDQLRTKFIVPNGGTTADVRLFTHLKDDTVAPVVQSFAIDYGNNTTFRNQRTVRLLGFYSDNVVMKDADFYYFDPAQSAWLYLATESAANNYSVFEWYIPSTLLGSNYKIKTIAHDYQGNASAPQEWGPFTIVDGSSPGGSIQVQGLTNNSWGLGETKTISWNYAGANALQSISSIWLYYGPNSAQDFAHNYDITRNSKDYTMPLYNGYVSDSAFIRINWCDVNNNCSSLDSDPFKIVDNSPPPPAPWGVPQIIDGTSSNSSSLYRYVQKLFDNPDGSVEIIYTEYDGLYYTEPGQHIRIVYRKFVNGAWQTPLVLKDYLYLTGVSDEINFSPVRAVRASNGDIHIVYVKRRSSNDWQHDLDTQSVDYLHLAGGAIVSDRNISAGAVSSGDPYVAVNDQNRVFIIWRAGYSYTTSSGTSTLRYIEGDGASSWTSPTAITSEATGSYALALEQGAPVVVYQNSTQLNIIKQSGGNWSAPVGVNVTADGTREFNLFVRGHNIYEVFYMQSSAALNWRWGVGFTGFYLDDASHTTSILQNRAVIPSINAEDVRTYRILSETSGQYHVLYNKLVINANYYTGYVFFDGNGPHFNAKVSPQLASTDESVLFGSVRNNIVTEYFSSFTNGASRLQFNQANFTAAISQLPPATLTPVASPASALQDTISNPNTARNSTHQITYTPSQSVIGPGELRLNFALGFDLTSAAAVGDLTIAGGGVNWTTPVPADIHYANGQAIFRWTSGTLVPGRPVNIKIAAIKNPATAGSYAVTVATGPANFTNPYDQQTANLTVGDNIVSVSAFVPYPLSNPTITNIAPVETIIISSGATQVISFALADVNNDSISYTITPSAGSISVNPNPASPLTGTPDGQTINFTYFANGATGAQIITVTADDNEATGGGVVTYQIQLFVL